MRQVRTVRFLKTYRARLSGVDARLRRGQRVRVDRTWAAQLQSAAPVIAFSKRTPSLPGWLSRLLTGGEMEASGRLQGPRARSRAPASRTMAKNL
jgi:hypothetical protein